MVKVFPLHMEFFFYSSVELLLLCKVIVSVKVIIKIKIFFKENKNYQYILYLEIIQTCIFPSSHFNLSVITFQVKLFYLIKFSSIDTC